MATLLSGGIQVTALHNHLLRASPAIFYMHVAGHGDPVKLASNVRAALALTKLRSGKPLLRRAARRRSTLTRPRSTKRSAQRAR